MSERPEDGLDPALDEDPALGEDPALDEDPALGEDPELDVHDEEYPVDGPIEVDVELAAGHVELRLVDGATEARIELRRPDRAAEPEGLSGLLNWVGEQIGGYADGVSAVHDATVEFGANRLRIRSSRQLPLRLVPLHVRVTAPADSSLRARTGGASVRTAGRLDGAHVHSGSGAVTLDEVAGGAELQAGTGAVRIGSVAGSLRLRTGAGAVSVDRVRESAAITTGRGDIDIGTVRGDVLARTGHGDITVRAAASGTVELDSGAGDLHIGLPAGVPAELDLRGSPGRMHSDLEISEQRPQAAAAVRLRGRTGTGAVTLTRA